MESAISRTQTAFRLSKELLKRLKIEARKQNRSLNNFVESVLMDAVYRAPNAKTMAAVKRREKMIIWKLSIWIILRGLLSHCRGV